jgi:3-deoxy-D-manno-octulosonic-acid transferase
MILYTALYRLAIGAYFALVRMAALVNQKAALFVAGRKNLLSLMAGAMAGERRKRIWMHCASLGEFEQGRPVLEALHAQYPDYAIIVTFFSPSGYEVRKNYDGADHVFYLPKDTNSNAQQFLDIIQPSLCIFVKYEFWYYFLHNIAARKIPAVLISAIFNSDQGFFQWYGGLQRRMLRCFTHIFVQDESSAVLLKGIGADKVSISGDTRFDRVLKAAQSTERLAILEDFCTGHKILVAGSTWKDDEVLLEKALQMLPNDWKLVLVPHEIGVAHMRQIEDLFSGHLIKWSQYPENAQHTVNAKGISERVLLVDQVGLLLRIYRYATVAWIGGGFGKAGVHNVLEPAVYSVPCFYGPVFHQFIEAKELVAVGGAFTCATPADLSDAISSMEVNNAMKESGAKAGNYVQSNSGATARTVSFIQQAGILE